MLCDIDAYLDLSQHVQNNFADIKRHVYATCTQAANLLQLPHLIKLSFA